MLPLVLDLLAVPGVCQTAPGEASQFIRTYQSGLFREQGLDPQQYRKEELEFLGRQLPGLAARISKNLDKLPSEYEHPLFLLLTAEMSRISSIGSRYFERTLDQPIEKPPVIATVPRVLGTPVTTWHPGSRTSILFFDAASHAFLFQLANLVAQSIPLVEGNARLNICGIRPRINRSKEIRGAFQALLEACVYNAHMRRVAPFGADEAHQSLAIDGLYRPSLRVVLAHEYAHAVLRHVTDPKQSFPPERQNFSKTFYSQANELDADRSALAIATESGFRQQDALAGAWLFLKGYEILWRALALASTNNELFFGHTGAPVPGKPLFGCSGHPLADVRITLLEVAARTAWGPDNDDVLCPAYTVDWILEYLWTWARPGIQQRFKNGERPADHWKQAMECFQRPESESR